MKPRLQVSRAAIELIKTFEGYRRHAARLPNGRWTIGYGHTLTAREGAEVSPEDAEALLLYDLIAVTHAVNEHAFTALTQNQFDGLASFAFSIGVEAFRSSAVLRRVNEGNLLQAAYAMEMWRRADFEGERIVIDALVRRRSAEKTLFLTPTGGWTPAPSPVLPPKIDFEVEPFAPREAPLVVRASLTGEVAIAEREDPQPAPAAAEATPEPTASEQAAANLGARLEALLADEAPPVETTDAVAENAVDPAPAAQSEPASESADVPVVEEPATQSAEPEPAPPPQAERHDSPTLKAPETFALTSTEAAQAVTAEPEAAPPLGPALLDVAPPPQNPRAPQTRPDPQSTYDSAFSLERAEPGGFTGMPLLALAVVGLVVFAGGVFWGLNAAPDPSGGIPMVQAMGWLLGVVGVVCFGVAAYGLLRQLGGIDEVRD